MRPGVLIFSLIIVWVWTIPAHISDLSKTQAVYFEAHQVLHFDAAVPKVNAGSPETFLSLHAFAPSIPLIRKPSQTVAIVDPRSVLPSLPRLHLKLRVFRN